MVDGELVVDLWGGVADPATGRPWGERTCAVDLLGHEGRRRDGAAAARRARPARPRRARRDVWPEFAAAGKGAITVAQLGSHCGGVPGIASPFDLADPRGDGARAGRAGADRPGRLAVVPRVHLRLAGRRLVIARRRPQRRRLRARRDRAAARRPRPAHRPRAGRRARGRARAAAARSGLPARRLQRRRAGSPPRARVRQLARDPRGLERSPRARARSPGVGRRRHRAGARRRSTAGSSPEPGRSARERSSSAAGRPASATIRSRAAPCASGRPATSSRGRRARSGPPPDGFGHTGAGGSSHGGWPSLRTGFSYVTAELRSEDGDERARSLLAALHEALQPL